MELRACTSTPCRMSQIFDDAIDLRARLGAGRSRLAGVDGRAQRRLLRDRVGFFLQLLDHRIDVAPRLPQTLVESLVQSLLEDVFALGKRLLALRKFGIRLVECAALAFELDAIASSARACASRRDRCACRRF